MTGKQKKILIRIIISSILFIAFLIIPINNEYLKLVFAIIPFIVIGYDVVLKSIKNICHGQIFDENFLMTIASIGSFLSGYLSGSGDYAEGTAVMLFYQVGELFQSIAVNSSRKSISSLMNICPDIANLECENGTIKEVEPKEVPIGSIIVVKPGEKVPIDGVIENGSGSIDTSALTGESIPKDASVGDNIISGCISLNRVLKIRTTKDFGQSTVSKILELVENSLEKKSKSESFITRFARYYTPIVVFLAIALAVIPSIITADPITWINRALIFLVISCPCALVISVPLSFFGGIGSASKCGILIKGGNYLEALSKTRTIVFDKTGTLTQGVFKVTSICPQNNISESQLLKYTAYAESFSSHPIAQSIVLKYNKEINQNNIKNYTEIAGYGISCEIENKIILVGNQKLMEKNNINISDCKHIGTVIHIAIENIYAGHIIISDEIKTDSADTIKELKKNNIKTVMLTGDSKTVGEKIAEQLDIDTAYCELLPNNKVEIVEKLISELSEKEKLIFVGDGINDAPVISRADIGISMGAGSDAAIEASDIVLIDNKPSKIAKAMKISKKTIKIANQNIVFALSVKILVMLFGALGIANMWLAVFADVGVSVIAILNAMRTLKTEN